MAFCDELLGAAGDEGAEGVVGEWEAREVLSGLGHTLCNHPEKEG